MTIDENVSKTLNCMHEAGRVLMLAVDFYNGATADTNQSIRSAASDFEHQGGIDVISWDNYNRTADEGVCYTWRTGRDSGDCIVWRRE